MSRRTNWSTHLTFGGESLTSRACYKRRVAATDHCVAIERVCPHCYSKFIATPEQPQHESCQPIVERILDQRWNFEREHDSVVTEIHVSPQVEREILMKCEPLQAMRFADLRFADTVSGFEPPNVSGVDWYMDRDLSGESWRFVTAERR